MKKELSKFEQELKEAKNPAVKTIAKYLLSREDIRNNLEKPNKSLKEMFEYIKSKAKKKAENGCACIDNDTVFGWAVHYYDEDDLKVKKVQATVATSENKESKSDIEEKEVAKQPKKNKKTKTKDNGIQQLDIFSLEC
jgi:hypothetical protein